MVECHSQFETPSADACQIVLVDKIDVLSALGYHAVDQNGKPYGRVDVNETFSFGEDVSSVLSHEILEMALDPFINQWRTDPSNAIRWALEASDQTQGDDYVLDGVVVSNFLLPNAFQRGATSGFDWMGLMTSPFSIRPGGYAIQTTPSGERRSVYGDKYVERPSKKHHSSRSSKRMKSK